MRVLKCLLVVLIFIKPLFSMTWHDDNNKLITKFLEEHDLQQFVGPEEASQKPFLKVLSALDESLKSNKSDNDAKEKLIQAENQWKRYADDGVDLYAISHKSLQAAWHAIGCQARNNVLHFLTFNQGRCMNVPDMIVGIHVSNDQKYIDIISSSRLVGDMCIASQWSLNGERLNWYKLPFWKTKHQHPFSFADNGYLAYYCKDCIYIVNPLEREGMKRLGVSWEPSIIALNKDASWLAMANKDKVTVITNKEKKIWSLNKPFTSLCFLKDTYLLAANATEINIVNTQNNKCYPIKIASIGKPLIGVDEMMLINSLGGVTLTKASSVLTFNKLTNIPAKTYCQTPELVLLVFANKPNQLHYFNKKSLQSVFTAYFSYEIDELQSVNHGKQLLVCGKTPDQQKSIISLINLSIYNIKTLNPVSLFLLAEVAESFWRNLNSKEDQRLRLNDIRARIYEELDPELKKQLDPYIVLNAQ